MIDSIARLRSIIEHDPTPEELFIVLDDLPALLDCAEALARLHRNTPTLADMMEAGWDGSEINEAMEAHEQAIAALSTLNGKSNVPT